MTECVVKVTDDASPHQQSLQPTLDAGRRETKWDGVTSSPLVGHRPLWLTRHTVLNGSTSFVS